MFSQLTKNFSSLSKQKQLNKKVEQMLASMSLDQKLGQMMQVERMNTTAEDVKEYHIGSVLSAAGSYPKSNTPTDWIELNDSYWQASVESDEHHLSIPILYGVDAIHGNSTVQGATIFPHNIGLGAANDLKLIERIGKVTAKEVLATGISWVFGPNLAIAKDIHWGRLYESYSEDPERVSKFAAKMVSGLQQPQDKSALLSCVKHFVGDGGTYFGIDQGDTALAFEELEQTHLKPFISAIDAGALTVMASFSSWNGTKCHGSRFLLTEVLKEKMKFKGFVISDMEGIEFLSEGTYCAVVLAVNAGIDMFMAPNNWKKLIIHLRNHLELGTVSINRINDAVRRILYVKFASGLFDLPKPSERPWANHESFGCAKHREVAREAVRKSLVLLKNESKVLPLKNNARVFVTGKNADNIGRQCGGFTIDWQGRNSNTKFPDGTSIWQGIKEVCPEAVLSNDRTGREADSKLHDVAVVVIGERSYAEGLGDIRTNDNVIVETGSLIDGSFNVLEPYGTSLHLNELHPEDLSAIEEIIRKGIPVVTILLSGRPIFIEPELNFSNAFIAAWLPGTEGQGVSDVLFGDHNFKGKLSFTWPKASEEDKNEWPTTGSLFPINYGLTY